MMPSLTETYESSVKANEINGAVFIAQDTTGKFNLSKAFGHRTTIDGAKKQLQLDDVLFMASCTKLMTTIAALQCVERGLISLTEDVARVVPHLGEVGVLTHFDEAQYGKAIIEKKKNPITLSHLLTHATGLKYELMDPLLLSWRKTLGQQPNTGATVLERFGFPLTFHPGTEWMYGPSLDWAGKVVEGLTSQTLEEYFRKHIWDPVGVTDTTFWPLRSENLKDRMVDRNPSDPQGMGLAVLGPAAAEPGSLKDCLGGQGSYSTAPDFIRILHSLLANDGKLLKKETVETLMFKPQLAPEPSSFLKNLLKTDQGHMLIGHNLPKEVEKSFGFGGLLVEEDIEGWHGAGTLLWGGGANSNWFIDPKNGLCGFTAPQLKKVEFLAAVPEKLKLAFKRGVYDEFALWKKSQS